jgi:hypothetical protein
MFEECTYTIQHWQSLINPYFSLFSYPKRKYEFHKKTEGTNHPRFSESSGIIPPVVKDVQVFIVFNCRFMSWLNAWKGWSRSHR